MSDYLYLTALPNDKSDERLRVSVYLTPSLDQNTGPLTYPFADWPAAAKTLTWQLSFYDSSHNLIGVGQNLKGDPDPPKLDSTLWKQVFGSVERGDMRGANRRLHRTWRLSHNISRLHADHQLLRLAHAYRQLYTRTGTGPGATEIDPVIRITQPPPLFLHPSYNSDLAVQFDDRSLVESLWPPLIAPLPSAKHQLLERRVTYAQGQLEDYGGAPLSAVCLAALYANALESLLRPGKPDTTVDPLILGMRDAVLNWPSQFKGTHEDIDRVMSYLLLLLFHRRINPDNICDNPITKPGFHQLLGLVQHYPAILRTLGLVFDFTVDAPKGVPTQCSIQATAKSTDSTLTAALKWPSFTQCSLEPSRFYARPEDSNLIAYRFLNLNAKNADNSARFSLVSENADGQSLKLTDQTNNNARSQEFKTSAPTALSAPDTQPSADEAGGWQTSPHAVTNPLIPPPSPRTVGIALFDNDRLIQLEKGVGKVDAPADNTHPVPPTDLFAEDITLGYRVDVSYRSHYYSLCERSSCYGIYQPRTDQHLRDWVPTTERELKADEGFVSFGATQSVLQSSDDPQEAGNTQTQIHQCIFTWTGWSLSVPQPRLPEMNPEAQNTSTDDAHLAIQPKYQIAGKLPPLRFEQSVPPFNNYIVRCRVVDLAGNSPPGNYDPDNSEYGYCTLKPDPQFSRHEPIRAPEFLLTRPIHRASEPGTHVDRIVARDNDGSSARVLAAPRESLRLAELSGILTNDRLPPTAFGEQQLLSDGSFPSVTVAKQRGWVSGGVDTKGDKDPIFLLNVDGSKPENPYYPDPLANFIRIDAFVMTDEPSVSIPRGTHWLSINPQSKWPERRLGQIRMVPSEGVGDPQFKIIDEPVDMDNMNGPFVPTLEVTLPKARTVILNVCSVTASQRPDAGVPPLPRVHVFNLGESLKHLGVTAVSSRLTPKVRAATQSLTQFLAQAGDTGPTAWDFVGGNVELMTPRRTMTLVHAVRRPLTAPAFAPATSAEALTVVRDPGVSQAHVNGAIEANWISTGKITAEATWSDLVDDLKQPRPRAVHQRQVAFAVTSKDFLKDTPDQSTRFRTLGNSVSQHFTDTRAHTVTYSLAASTRFREYYPGAGSGEIDNTYSRNGEKLVILHVLASVAPPAPLLRYILPAFLWTETYDRATRTWYSGRTVVFRVWLDRPMKVQGDQEMLGVVIADPNSSVAPANQTLVSRWGADPARAIIAPIQQNELTEANLCEASHVVEKCILPSGDRARVKPCEVEYCEERRSWYSDIPINTQGANAPFIRLALVRWQPEALTSSIDARVSEVVLADFMQLNADRWASVQTLSHRRVRVAISGAFASPDANIPASKDPLSLTLQSRWYALGRDTGWRNVDLPNPPKFVYTPAPSGQTVSTWSTELDLPHSAYDRRYRLFLRETDWFVDGSSGAQSYAQFIELP